MCIVINRLYILSYIYYFYSLTLQQLHWVFLCGEVEPMLQKGENSDSDVDPGWTDNDIQPVFERESSIIMPFDKKCSEFDCFSLLIDRDK